MTKKQKKYLLRILISAAMTAILHFLPLRGIPRFSLYLLTYLIIGYDVLWDAFLGICHGQLLDESFLMALATVGAMALGVSHTGDYTEAVAVMLFYQTGELFQSVAVGKSRRNIAALMDIRPDQAWVLSEGQPVLTDPSQVPVGETILVRPGEKIPIDGVVMEGHSSLDTAALTGESVPTDVAPGMDVISGCINLSGPLTIRTTQLFENSTVSRILDLVENAAANKAPSEKFITRFARIYTPAVCISALALFLLPPVIALILGADPAWGQWLYRALSFLVASCPCALVISIPLSFFASIGGAGKAGILIKGSNYMEALAKADTVVFDKTGTLTQGVFQVTQALPVHLSPEELLSLAAHADCHSTHPISKALAQALDTPVDSSRVSQVLEQGGLGVTALVDGREVAVGNPKLMETLGIPHDHTSLPGTAVCVAVEGRFAGHILLADVIKPTAQAAMEALKKAGIRRTVLLTGDAEQAAAQIAAQLGIREYHSRLLPADKVARLEQILTRSRAATTAFVGDGINDAPVLSRADVGIAMGAMGSDAAIEAADIVLMDDDPRKIATAIGICKKCLRIVRQNIVFSIGVKILALIAVAAGFAGMWLAVFADVGVMVLAVLNSIRPLLHSPS